MRRKASKGEKGGVERGRRKVRRVLAALRSSRMQTFNATRFRDMKGIDYLSKRTFSGARGQTPDESKLKEAGEEVERERPTLSRSSL